MKTNKLDLSWMDCLFMILLGIGVASTPDYVFKSFVITGIMIINWRVYQIQTSTKETLL